MTEFSVINLLNLQKDQDDRITSKKPIAHLAFYNPPDDLIDLMLGISVSARLLFTDLRKSLKKLIHCLVRYSKYNAVG